MINNIKGQKTEKPILVRINSGVVTEPSNVANYLNDYFSQVAISNVTSLRNMQPVIGDSPIMSMGLFPVTEEEVATVINQLPSKRSTDVDGMSVWLLKQLSEHTGVSLKI